MAELDEFEILDYDIAVLQEYDSHNEELHFDDSVESDRENDEPNELEF